MATQDWDWIFHTLGWGLAGLGLLLALWALFWDRSRGRKRCPKCWYSMEGALKSEGGEDETDREVGARYTCPECGRRIINDRALHRTRRRMKRAALGIFVCALGYAVFITPAVRRDGWVAVTPTTALVLLASPEQVEEIAFSFVRLPTPTNRVEYELARRGEDGSVYNWQADLLAWRISRASVDSAATTEFKSYDISRLLSPAWWRSPIPFSVNDRAQVWTEFYYLWIALAIPDSWYANGGQSAGLARMGNRLYVWAPPAQQQVAALDLALLVTDGKEEPVSAPYWAFDEILRSSFEIRIYDVSDLAPPNVERFEMPPPDPNEDIQWGYFDGELVLHSQEIFDLIDDIVNSVESDYWVENGGKDAMILTVPGRLIITASPEMHKQVAQRLDFLRETRMSETDGTP